MAFRSPNAFHLLLVLIFTWFVPVSFALAQDNDPWSFRNNRANTGVSTFSGPFFPDRQWTFNTSGFTYSSPAVTDNAIYIASENELIALDLEGNELWSVLLNDGSATVEGVEITGFVSTPAISSSGVIYVGSLDHNLYAINPDGTVIGTYDTSDQIFSSPVIGPDGRVFVASTSGFILELDPGLPIGPDNPRRWFFSTEFYSTPALSPDGILYIGGTDGQIYALDTNNSFSSPAGWNPFFAQDDIISSPALFNGVLYVGSSNNQFYAINASSGAPIWGQPFTGNDVFVSSPAIGETNGAVYAGSFDGSVYAINRATGLQRWTFDTGELLASSPTVDNNGFIFVTTLGGTLYVLQDAGSQALVRWTYALGASAWASPSIGPGNNTVYIAASGSQTTPGRLFALGPSQYEVDLNPGLPIAGQALDVSIRLAGTQTGANVTFFYRSAGEPVFKSTTITGSGIIPGTDITGEGFEYYIEGPQGTFPSQSPASQPATRPVFVQQITSGLEIFPRLYKMVSIPFEMEDPSILSVLNDFGPYDPAVWRLLRWNGVDYNEYPDLDDTFTPGTAFFLITSSDTTFAIQNATSVNTSEPYSIELTPGWNQIGNPFGFPVLLSNVIRNTSLVSSFAYFNGVEMLQNPEVVNTLLPWEGYFVFNSGTENTAIQVQPVTASNSAGKQSTHSAARLQVIASLGESDLRDTQNWVGFHHEASDGRDHVDVLEAPPFGEEYIRLSIGSAQTPLALEYKPLTQQGNEWSLYVTASTERELSNGDEILLSFAKNDQFPEDFELALIDEDHGFAQRITDASARIQWDQARDMRSLRLLTGTGEYINSRIQSIPMAPEAYSLEQNFPNPFRQQTSIRYQISKRSDVSLVVYNALGQEIKTLVRSTQSPGSFEAMWDGKDTQGQRAPSGIYFYRLLADDFQATGRMTLIH